VTSYRGIHSECPGEKKTAKPKREINNHQTYQDQQTPLGNNSPKKPAYSPKKQQRTFFKTSEKPRIPAVEPEGTIQSRTLEKLIQELRTLGTL
jgi:hypothetical protein